MKIIDLYTPFIETFRTKAKHNLEVTLKKDSRFSFLKNTALEWGETVDNIERWIKTPEYKKNESVARDFISRASDSLKRIEKHFGSALKGELRLCPSMMLFDGFARYDQGQHQVWFGVDHPDADAEYLDVLLSHELSHVYRDHQPRVWAFLGKPLVEVTRQEYLDNASAQEHLASEGLATLNSQLVFPRAPLHVHHYYIESEMQWCLDHFPQIDKAIRECIGGDENVWKFYGEDTVGAGSPSRTQYFWAAKILSDWLPKKTGSSLDEAVLAAHGWPASEFDCFK